MTFTFLDMAGKTLFVRDDAERATWTQEELSLDMDFPQVNGKTISTGQRVFFIDPVGNHQVYEIKNAKTMPYDGGQQIHAEHICISELSDEHIDNKEVTNKTCSSVLSDILTGTLWGVGSKTVNPTSSVDLSRGSVWQAVLQIKDNFNVYIEPRVTLHSDGTIARKLDIISTDGVWRGLRLSVDKNFLDPSVTFDDSEVATALYGYGGTIHDKSGKGEDKECTFADIVWSKTSDHPAKPKGQTYLEDPTATREYGRNGRARYGFYQNTAITDPEILLQKTWETLQTVNSPSISVDGTVADLYRLGYADQPLMLHDIALVEILPAGFKKQIQIIRLTVDLLDPSNSPVTIGAYIPNIIYIQRETEMQTTGSRGGGGGNKSKEPEKKEFEAAIESINAGTGLRFTAFQRDMDHLEEDIKLQEASIKVEHNRITQEVTDRREADTKLATTYDAKITVEAKRITQEVTERKNGEKTLNSKIEQNADNISLVVKNGKVDRASLVLAINNGKSSATIKADEIDIQGIVSGMQALSVRVQSLVVDGEATFLSSVNADSFQGGEVNVDEVLCDTSTLGSASCSSLTSTGALSGASLSTSGSISGGAISGSSVSASGTVSATSGFKTGSYTATWKSYTARKVTVTGTNTFTNTGGQNVQGRLVTGYDDTTIYYLGHT